MMLLRKCSNLPSARAGYIYINFFDNRRTYDFALPMEAARARKAYGVAGSAINYFCEYSKSCLIIKFVLIIVFQSCFAPCWSLGCPWKSARYFA